MTSAKASLESGGSCGQVRVDCKTHKIEIKGQSKTINCGRNGTTITGTGKVGGPHRGKVVPDGVDIQTPRMGQAGGGKVFHTPNPRSMSGTPTGVDTSKGCVIVDLATLNILKGCQGSPLQIIGNDNGGGPRQQFAESSPGGRSPASGRRGAR